MSKSPPNDRSPHAATSAPNPHLVALLTELEGSSKIADFEIGSRFHALASQHPDLPSDPFWRAEAIGFGFGESIAKEDRKDEGDFYVPSVTWVTNDGEAHGTPDASLITPAMVKYWQQRCGETNNPLLKARYSGLVWEFCKRVTGERPSHEFARIHVAALVAIADRDLDKFEVDAIHKLWRALNVSCSLKAVDLTQLTKAAILRYEDRIAVDEKLGLWGFSFDILVGNKCANLTTGEEANIIGALESRLERFSNRGLGIVSDPFRSEAAVGRLAEYYRGAGHSDDVVRVIRKVGSIFIDAMDTDGVAALQALSWAERLHGIYKRYGLNEDAEVVARRVREIGHRVRGEMKGVSHEMKIPMEELDALVDKLTSGGFERAMSHIAVSFIPKRKKIEDLLNTLAKTAPLQAHIPKHITDGDGRLLSVVGSLAEDLDGNIVLQMSQNMALEGVLLGATIDKARDKHHITATSLASYLYRCPAFAESHRTSLATGLTAYFAGDYAVSAHMLIPQLESAARELLERAGGAVLKSRPKGGFDLKSLGDIVREDAFKMMFNEDFALYLMVLLTDPRGWNLRNTVMHGMQSDEAFTKTMLDRIIHVLLCFALAIPVAGAPSAEQ